MIAFCEALTAVGQERQLNHIENKHSNSAVLLQIILSICL